MEWMRTVIATAANPVVGDLHLDETGDFVWSTDLLDRVAQSLSGRLSFPSGTWYLDLTEGIPYLEGLLGTKGVSDSSIEYVFTKVILNTPGVAVVDFVRVTRDSTAREIFLDYRGRLATGYVFSTADSGPFRVRYGGAK